MGSILSFIRKEPSIKELDAKFALFIDFEKEKNDDVEEQIVNELYLKVNNKIQESSELLKFLSSYGPGVTLCYFIL